MLVSFSCAEIYDNGAKAYEKIVGGICKRSTRCSGGRFVLVQRYPSLTQGIGAQMHSIDAALIHDEVLRYGESNENTCSDCLERRWTSRRNRSRTPLDCKWAMSFKCDEVTKDCQIEQRQRANSVVRLSYDLIFLARWEIRAKSRSTCIWMLWSYSRNVVGLCTP